MLKLRSLTQPLYLMHRLSRWHGRARWRLQCALLNLQPGVRISPSVKCCGSAAIQLVTEGKWVGGQVVIEAGVVLSDGVIIAPYRGSVYLGERVYVGPYSVLYGSGGLSVGCGTMIASHCVIVSSGHGMERDRMMIDQPNTKRGISIAEDVWIGAGVRILDGVCLGKGCIVGAGAVVTRAVPEYAIAAGVPARIIGHRN